jgi:glycosyltransferase involved in cell wall biosynthesis
LKNKKHIVIVSAWFYPENKVASFRLNAFAKYLDRDRFKVTVISMTHGNKSSLEYFETDIPVYREIYNAFVRLRKQKPDDSFIKHNLLSLNNKLISLFSSLDYPGWSDNVLSRLIKINETEPIDLILSSYAPVDAHIAAFNFKLQNSNVKWIADMRDEMSRNRFLPSKAKRKLAKWEQHFLPEMDALTTVSEPILVDFDNILGDNSILFREIRNGFDHDMPMSETFNSNFTMLYSGTFYSAIKPDTLFHALVELHRNELLGPNWVLKLLGTHRNFSLPQQIAKHIEILPPVSNREAVEQMMHSDCNVFIHPPMGTLGVYSGKLFEYLSTGKPVLALVDTEDVAAKLISEMKAGEVVPFHDIQAIQEAILRIYENWKNMILPEINEEKRSSLHRRKQVKVLEELIDELLQ